MSKITLQEFAEKYLDRLYDSRFSEDEQCAGWYSLKRSVIEQADAPTLYSVSFHPIWRDIITKNWAYIKSLPVKGVETGNPIPAITDADKAFVARREMTPEEVEEIEQVIRAQLPSILDYMAVKLRSCQR